LDLVEWLRREEREVWNWFVESREKEDYGENLRLSLLKNTYRMDAGTHADLFRELDAAKSALEVDVAVHLYQAQGETQANATIYHLPEEAHLVFSGPVLTLLTPDEIRSVIGHELAHHHLWNREEGAYLIADRILDTAAAHPGSQPSHGHSARIWHLATELFADRGAFLAAGDLETAVSGLVKISTGLQQISARSYLQQAEEVFSKSKPKTDRLSHPDTFMRARALQLWAEEAEDLDRQVAAMLDLDGGLETLSLPEQAQLTELTRRFLGQFLRPKWFQSDDVLAHARAFFPGFEPAQEEDLALRAELQELTPQVRDYLCAVMADFCAVDAGLDEVPVAAAIEWARELECLGALEKMLTRELKLKTRDVKRLKDTAEKLIEKAEEAQA
jgi:hypothetical protein